MLKIFGTRKKKEKINFPIGELMVVDMHSHVLPGIDDGADSVATSRFLIDTLLESGIKEIITTPHVMADIHKNTPTSISGAYDSLQGSIDEHKLNNLSYAGEYLIDEQFIEKLHKKEVLTIRDKYILIETPFFYKPLNFESAVFEVLAAGYTPILAHPERYLYMFNQLDMYQKVKELGCLLQINALSLTGYYGKMEKDSAKLILSAGLVDFIGTDMHHERHAKMISDYKVDNCVADLLTNVSLKNSELLT